MELACYAIQANNDGDDRGKAVPWRRFLFFAAHIRCGGKQVGPHYL